MTRARELSRLVNTDVITTDSNFNVGIGISDDDPNASYSTSSIDGTYDTIASHTPTLYGATSGPNNYYNWNESTYDEWLTASTAQWPSDTQLDLQIS